jgi:hypothetical protein
VFLPLWAINLIQRINYSFWFEVSLLGLNITIFWRLTPIALSRNIFALPSAGVKFSIIEFPFAIFSTKWPSITAIFWFFFFGFAFLYRLLKVTPLRS